MVLRNCHQMSVLWRLFLQVQPHHRPVVDLLLEQYSDWLQCSLAWHLRTSHGRDGWYRSLGFTRKSSWWPNSFSLFFFSSRFFTLFSYLPLFPKGFLSFAPVSLGGPWIFRQVEQAGTIALIVICSKFLFANLIYFIFLNSLDFYPQVGLWLFAYNSRASETPLSSVHWELLQLCS